MPFIRMDIINNQRVLEVKLFYIAVMTLSLGGCEVTNTKENPDICKESTDTIRRKYNRTTSVNKEVINADTSERIEFIEAAPLKVFSGIESANLNNSNLSLKIINKGFFEQYSAPVVKPIDMLCNTSELQISAKRDVDLLSMDGWLVL